MCGRLSLIDPNEAPIEAAVSRETMRTNQGAAGIKDRPSQRRETQHANSLVRTLGAVDNIAKAVWVGGIRRNLYS